MIGTAFNALPVPGVEILFPALGFPDRGLQLRLRVQAIQLAQALARGRDEVDELLARHQQVGEKLDEGRSQLRRRHLGEGGAERRQHQGVDPVGLSLPAEGLGKAPRLARVDDADVEELLANVDSRAYPCDVPMILNSR